MGEEEEILCGESHSYCHLCLSEVEDRCELGGEG